MRCLCSYLRAEPHLAAADDADEGELAAVGWHVLLQPTFGAEKRLLNSLG
jgi:hypothetical protein